MPCLQPPFEPNSQRKTGTNSPPAQHDAPIATVPAPRRGDRTSRRFWEGFPVLQTMGIRPAILVTSYAIRDEQGGENKSVWWINTQARFHQKQDEARLSQPSLLVAAAALVPTKTLLHDPVHAPWALEQLLGVRGLVGDPNLRSCPV